MLTTLDAFVGALLAFLVGFSSHDMACTACCTWILKCLSSSRSSPPPPRSCLGPLSSELASTHVSFGRQHPRGQKFLTTSNGPPSFRLPRLADETDRTSSRLRTGASVPYGGMSPRETPSHTHHVNVTTLPSVSDTHQSLIPYDTDAVPAPPHARYVQYSLLSTLPLSRAATRSPCPCKSICKGQKYLHFCTSKAPCEI